MSLLVQKLAQELNAYKNCKESGNTEWADKHENNLINLIDNWLPHGSGIDGNTTINIEKSNDTRLVIESSYHHLNEYGFYDGWTDFSVIIRPSLSFVFTIRVVGQFPRKYSDTRDYLCDIFDSALRTVMEENNVTYASN